jgi:hypothetical protein
MPSLSKSARTWLIRLGSVLLVVYVIFAGFVWWAMCKPPETFGRVMSKMPAVAYVMIPFETMWIHARAGKLQVGDAAPDFSLQKLDNSERVHLAELSTTQPVVLIFGSYT